MVTPAMTSLWRARTAWSFGVKRPLDSKCLNGVPFEGEATALSVDDVDLDRDFDIVIGTETGIRLIGSVSLKQSDTLSAHSCSTGLNQVEPWTEPTSGRRPGAELERYLDAEELNDPNVLGRPVISQRAIRSLDPAAQPL